MRSTIYVALMTLSGCVATARPVMLPNGMQGLAINCGGAHRDIADCMNKAAQMCAGPYEMLDRDGGVIGGGAVPVGRGAIGLAAVQRTLIVKCGAG